MQNLNQQLTIVLDAYAERVKDALKDEEFLNGLETLIVKLIIDRIEAGYDIYSRKFGGYNRSYKKSKAYEYATERNKPTRYASRSASDKLRLTGNLLSGIKAKTARLVRDEKNGGFIIRTGVYLLASQREKAEGLGSTTGVARNHKRYSKKAYLFLGLAVSGSYVQKETKAINKYIADYIGEKLIKKINKSTR